MKRKFLFPAVGGFAIGILALMLTAFSAAPKLMIIEDRSAHGFDETIQILHERAVELNWKIPTVHLLHEAVSPYGYEVGRVAVLELCQPHHAAKILADESAKVVTSMMPCRISVYEKANGDVIVSRMNTGLMAQAFGGTVAAVMAEATRENEMILESVLR